MRTAEDIENVRPSHYEMDENAPEEPDQAFFGMGCFWGVEALFGGLEGVYRTAVGYTGGEKEHPTYRSLGKHTETVMVEFDPEEVSYRELLNLFFNNQNYERKNKAQYASKIFYLNEEQREIAEEELPENAAKSVEELDVFWLAEDYHQKYKLRGTSEAEKILEHYNDEEFIRSTVAAKLNARKAGKVDHPVDFHRNSE